MKNIYRIGKIDLQDDPSEHIWSRMVPINIDFFPWDANHYRPRTEVRMFYNETDFHVQFKAREPEITVSYYKMDDPVYKDSCVELFLNPCPENGSQYINFEINPIGTMLAGIGTNKQDRKRITSNAIKSCKVKTSITEQTVSLYNGEYWEVQLSIPFLFLEHYFGKLDFIQGKEMQANFYKCGDESLFPHYGCWNEIKAQSPNFHCPEYFGKILLLS
ncbi:hypothetical protein CVD28_06445 [Bacillus sp. M6-12]|uniref:carbohydrate-binding family 9-like protein n=1 Tax=Bacillus sp. M6-12 TaxID=2054166 RepID=UPI000C767897|nr:carbohydrate-binding family 9-like protein [Bacillus sp. M6-12]PLS18751.1 hypothetical protein CVD28_06445 [Bacillus sp. M6-12]